MVQNWEFYYCLFNGYASSQGALKPHRHLGQQKCQKYLRDDSLCKKGYVYVYTLVPLVGQRQIQTRA